MKKSVLKEYQKKTEEILVALSKYQTIRREGIEESQKRTDSRLEELQARREELEQPIDMSDVRATLIDRRTPARDNYSDDREGFLLSEYDKRRLDGYEGPKFAEIVAEIKAIREAKRLEEKELVEEEMQSLIEEQLEIDNARFTEANKDSFMMQLQEEKAAIEASIQEKQARAEEEMAKFDATYEEGKVHLQVLELYKDQGSKVYTAAKEEHEKCVERAAKTQEKVKRMSRQIARLQQDLGEVDKLLEKLADSREMDEIAEQEDKMWEEFRAEEEATKQEEIDKAYAEKEAAERNQQKAQEKAIEEETKREVEEYDKNLGDKLDNTGIGMDGLDSGKPSGAPPKPGKNDGQKPPVPPKKEKWKVESVAFTIEGGSNPVYRITVSNGKEQKEIISREVATLDPEFDKDEIRRLREKKGIYKADRCYDQGLANALKRLDEEYGSSGLKEYQELLRDREMILRYPEKYENAMNISYDFSGLLTKPNEDMIKLQRMAKANERKGAVAEVKGRPNFLMRFIKRMLTKQIPETTDSAGEPKKAQKAEEKMSATLEELNAQMARESQELTETRMLKDWSDMHTEPEFDIEEFVKDMPVEEANKYRVMQDEYEAGLEQDPYVAFRKKMQEGTEKSKRPVKEDKKEPEKGDEVIKVDPADVKIYDGDGREIG